MQFRNTLFSLKDLLLRDQLIKCPRTLSSESLVKLSTHLRRGGGERISKASLLYSCPGHMVLRTWLKSYPFVFGDRYLFIRTLTCCSGACPPEGPSTMEFFSHTTTLYSTILYRAPFFSLTH